MPQSVALANTIPPVTAKQRVVLIPGDHPEERIEGQTLTKGRF